MPNTTWRTAQQHDLSNAVHAFESAVEQIVWNQGGPAG